MNPMLCAGMLLALTLCSCPLWAVPPEAGKKAAAADTVAQAGYRIDQPGTITFTVGMVIKGKVEKPQVMIFLPKEKTYFRQRSFTHSFRDALGEPLPFSPQVE
ncbi:MAG: hypothetical protein JXA71_06615 [Chitinispirillaceae bacterium]|nr:hypothetical protein [Chitinispirillaceae bacterium]